MALEPEPGEKGIGCLAALCHTEKEKEGEVQPSHGKTQEKADHYWSEAVDKGRFIYDRDTPSRYRLVPRPLPVFQYCAQKKAWSGLETRQTIRFIAIAEIIACYCHIHMQVASQIQMQREETALQQQLAVCTRRGSLQLAHHNIISYSLNILSIHRQPRLQ